MIKALHLGGANKQQHLCRILLRQVSRTESTLCKAHIYISFVKILSRQKKIDWHYCLFAGAKIAIVFVPASISGKKSPEMRFDSRPRQLCSRWACQGFPRRLSALLRWSLCCVDIAYYNVLNDKSLALRARYQHNISADCCAYFRGADPYARQLPIFLSWKYFHGRKDILIFIGIASAKVGKVFWFARDIQWSLVGFLMRM